MRPRVDPVHGRDQKLRQVVGDFPEPLVDQRRQERGRRVGRAAAQVGRRFDRAARPPPGQDLRGDIREQPRGQADPARRLQFAGLGEHRLQAHVAGHRLDQREDRLGVLRLVLSLFSLGVLAPADQGQDPAHSSGVQARGDRGKPVLLRGAQGRGHHPADPPVRRRLDPLLAHPLQQFDPYPLRVALRVGDARRQPVGQLVRIGDRALPKPQMVAYLPAMPLDRPPGPLVEPEVACRRLQLPGDVLDHFVRELRTAPGEPPIARIELQHQREAQPGRAVLGLDQVPLTAEHRPVLNQLIHAHRRTLHGRTSCRGQPPVCKPQLICHDQTFWRPVTAALTAPQVVRHGRDRQPRGVGCENT